MRFSSLILGAAAFLAAVCTGEEVVNEEGVYVLQDKNFQSFIKENAYVLAEFYAPWCGHCKALAPEYAKAAKQLAESGSLVKLAKIDATVEKEAAASVEVKGYPTIKFFRNGSPMDYQGGRQAEDIIKWINKKLGPAAVTVTEESQFKSIKDESEAVVIGFFEDIEGPAAKEFLEAAKEFDDCAFAMTSTADVRKAAEVKETGDRVVLFKKFDEKRVEYEGKMLAKDIKEFVAPNYVPSVMEFNEENQAKIFGGSVKSHNLLFGTSKQLESVAECYSEAAKNFKGKIIFITVDTESPMASQILQFFKIEKNDPLSLRIINLTEDLVKYSYEGEVTCDVFAKYAQDYVDNKLTPYLASAPLPDNWDAEPVKVLVQSNFNKVAMNPEAFAFVEFYAPWCGHCKALAPIWEQLAKAFAAYPELTIAKIDATENEIKDFPVQGFPTLKFFNKGKVVEYTTERDLKGLVKFIEEQTGFKAAKIEEAVVEEDEEEEEEEEAAAPVETKEEVAHEEL